MKELLSYLLDLGGKWVARMMRANPRAFFTGLGLGLVLAALGYMGFHLLREKSQVATTLGSDRNAQSPRIKEPQSNARPSEGSSTPTSGRAESRDRASEAKIEGRTFRITYPFEGEVVNETVEVRAVTPYAGWNHYLVVTPSTGGDFVQDELLKPSSGELVGQATIGTAVVGASQRFVLRVFATKEVMANAPGQLPQDAIFSRPIAVYRR